MKNLYISIIILTLSFLTFSCQKEVRSTPELVQIFNTEEIEDINLIVEYFEYELIKHYNTKNIDSAYIKFVNLNIKNHSNELKKFDYKDIKALYEKIDESTFNHIWEVRKDYDHILKDSVRRFNIADDKKYMQFLSIIATKNSKIIPYIDHLKSLRKYLSYYTGPIFTNYNNQKNAPLAPTEFGNLNIRVIRSITLIGYIDIKHNNSIQQIQ
jgi:hypothetical protein